MDRRLVLNHAKQLELLIGVDLLVRLLELRWWEMNIHKVDLLVLGVEMLNEVLVVVAVRVLSQS